MRPTNRLAALSTALLLSLPFASCAATAYGPGGQGDDAFYSEPSSRRFTVLLGQRSLEEDDFAPVEDQPMLGFEFSDGGTDDGLVGFEIGVTGSSESDDVFLGGPGTEEVEGSVGELYAGVRKEFLGSAVNPFLGIGLSASRAEVEVGGNSEDDTAYGIYVHGGVVFPLSDAFALVADARARFGEDYRIANVDGEGDFFAIALGISFGF